MTKLPKHLQDKINKYETKRKELFGETSEEYIARLEKCRDEADDFHPIHAMIF